MTVNVENKRDLIGNVLAIAELGLTELMKGYYSIEVFSAHTPCIILVDSLKSPPFFQCWTFYYICSVVNLYNVPKTTKINKLNPTFYTNQ